MTAITIINLTKEDFTILNKEGKAISFERCFHAKVKEKYVDAKPLLRDSFGECEPDTIPVVKRDYVKMNEFEDFYGKISQMFGQVSGQVYVVDQAVVDLFISHGHYRDDLYVLGQERNDAKGNIYFSNLIKVNMPKPGEPYDFD